MSQQSKGKIAVIGSGLIGRSWCMVFVSEGYDVVIFDIVEEQVKNALTNIKRQIAQLEEEGLLRGSLKAEQQFNLISAESNIEKAVRGAIHVQECIPEVKDLKEKIFMQLDKIADEETVLASSSSAIPASEFTANMERRKGNVIIAHPVTAAN